MRSWYVLMVLFVTVLAIMAFLLGSIGHPDRTGTGGLTVTTGCRLPQDSPVATPCPWHLENITILDSHDRETVEIDARQETKGRSSGFAFRHHDRG
jgi:hypothetical protein